MTPLLCFINDCPEVTGLSENLCYSSVNDATHYEVVYAVPYPLNYPTIKLGNLSHSLNDIVTRSIFLSIFVFYMVEKKYLMIICLTSCIITLQLSNAMPLHQFSTLHLSHS